MKSMTLMAACLLPSITGLAAEGAAAQKRPNIVFILIDDLRYDATSAMGHPLARTPNMDRLAREGATFTRAFVTTSLCSPSRASFLTGCYGHRHGVWGNVGRDPDPQLPQYPELLQESGYETAFVGKWHMAGHDRPRPGFDHWVSFVGQGRYRRNRLNVDGQSVVSEEYVTDALTDYAVAFLRRKRAKPFLLCLSHKAVHAPFTPAKRHADLLADAEVRSQHVEGDRLDDKFPWGRKMPENWQELVRDYFEAVAAVDESLERVLETLEELNVLNDTLVLFTSDNGYFHGEHGGMWDKRAAYEPAIRIPMLLRYPPLAKAGSKIDELVLNIDVAPTLVELAGLEVPSTMQGRSILPLLEGGKGRDSFLYEYFRQGDRFNRPTVLAVRTRQYKYVTYPDVPDAPAELYDLQNDPDELVNLMADPRHRQTAQSLAQELDRLKQATGFRMP